jgi:hypothetical protein
MLLFLTFLRKRERYGRSVLTICLLRTYQLINLLNLGGNSFEAGLGAAEEID